MQRDGPGQGRSWGRRAGRPVVGRARLRAAARLAGLVVVTVVALELALRAAALVAGGRLESRRDPATAIAGADLAVWGDSTPFGYRAGTSFPAEIARATGARVVNRSRPALNSTQVARVVAEDLREGAPRAMLVMVGVNDAWNLAGVEPEQPGLRGRLRALVAGSRLRRLLRIWWTTARSEGDLLLAESRPGRGAWDRREENGRRFGSGGIARITRRNLESIAALAHAAGSDVLFVGYQAPGWNGSADAVDALLAREMPGRFVPTRDLFVGRERDLLLDDAFHPNDEGQRLIAARVAQALAARGWRPSAAPPPAPSSAPAEEARPRAADAAAPAGPSAAPPG